MSALARIALRAYPPSFRSRYDAELAALVADTGASTSAAVDLMLGAVRAWLRPTFPGPDGARRRLQASVATTWVAWCAGFLVAPAVNRALLDAPTPGATGTVRSLLDIGYGLFFLGWGLAAVGVAPLVIRSVLPAVRAGDWAALRPLLPALALGVVEAGGLIAIAATRFGGVSLPSWVARGAVMLWLVGFAVLIVLLGVGPATSISRLQPSAVALRVPSVFAVALAVTLTAITGCSLAAAATAGDATLVNSAVPVWVAITIAILASLAALTSSVRGARAFSAR